jgi:hypothetical protein
MVKLVYMQTPESQDAQRRLLEDESAFIDVARSAVFMTEEHAIVSSVSGAPDRTLPKFLS